MVQNQLVKTRRDGESANHWEKRMTENLLVVRNDFFAGGQKKNSEAFQAIQLECPSERILDKNMSLVPLRCSEARCTETRACRKGVRAERSWRRLRRVFFANPRER